MKRLLQSDLTKILIFLILTSITAALLCPWLFNAGKMIAEVLQSRGTGSLVSWITQRLEKTEFIEFFHLSLGICALVLAGPFVMWLRLGNAPLETSHRPWSLKLPLESVAHANGQPLKHNERGWLHIGTGVLLASGLTLLMMWLLISTEWFVMEKPVMWWEAMQHSLLSATLSSVVQEWIFRGVLLGICLRAMRPAIAIFLTSFIFAIVHLLTPAYGAELAEPERWDAGFQMFALIGERFSQPANIVFPFLTFISIGIILAYARIRTVSLWLPIGLHFGWIFVHRIFDRICIMNGDHLSSANFFISHERTTGILPLSLLIATAMLVHVFAQISEEKRHIKKEKTTSAAS